MASINSAIELQAKAKRSRGDHEMAKILIVEDEPNMVAGLRDNFEYEGYEVISAPDGVAGLERALNQTGVERYTIRCSNGCLRKKNR